MLFPKKFFRASIYARGIADTANKIVVTNEVPSVKKRLSLTSFSCIVSNSSLPEVFRNKPINGAKINNNTIPPRKLIIKLK